MKVALLFCGQMRTFDHPKVLEKTNKLIQKFNCDVFVSTWSDRGVSLWSEHAVKNQLKVQEKEKNKIIVDDHIKLIQNVKKFEIDEYQNFLISQCDDDIRFLLTQPSDNLYASKATSNPCLYKIYCSYKLLEEYMNENHIEYDIIIKTRPDFLHVHNDIEKYFEKANDTLFHINTGYAYHPNRVFDIFFLSSLKNMKIVCESWLNYKKLSETNYSLEYLSKFDVCRMLYAQCVLNNIKIDTFDRVLGDIFRVENYDDYQSFESLF